MYVKLLRFSLLNALRSNTLTYSWPLVQRTSSSWSDPSPCALNFPRSTTYGKGQEVTEQHCGVTLKITFSCRWLTVKLLLKRFHSSWLGWQVPYSWRIWWCVWKVQNRSPVLLAVTGPALPGSGLRTSPSDGPASTNASANTQTCTGNVKCCFSVYYPDWSRKQGKRTVRLSCQRQACCSHSNRSQDQLSGELQGCLF